MLWKKFNDQVALVLLFLFVGVWVTDVILKNICTAKTGFSGEVMSATIVLVTLVVQYYFRTQPPKDNGQPPI